MVPSAVVAVVFPLLLLTAACGQAPQVAAAPSMTGGLSPGTSPAPVPPVPAAPAMDSQDDCLAEGGEVLKGADPLLCQYFTSGAMTPSSVRTGPGADSGTYAIRFAGVESDRIMTVRIPCASYAVEVDIDGGTVTPDPSTLESVVENCSFPWDMEQERMAGYLKKPLQVAETDSGITLSNPEWGISLLRTPYEAT
ncbi:hypothetical protein [Pseudarthrobacter sp. J64]|uniref:hypothetical protein n=1 Tax=Pseudarthrobacter sp. J64 TaxID=3116485 RepID=UPI002E81C546|nr:hypothetical protein [Pseudarthrobacter sp. J64]